LSDNERRLFLNYEFNIILNKENNKLALSDINLDDAIARTSGLFYGEMQTLCDYFKDFNQNDSLTYEERFTQAFEHFSTKKKFSQENKLNIECINWNDVGGLLEIKETITDTILLPLKYPQL
jgi:SpoVK/Ycf46/Vps4 family AAA+-type ATPase